MKAARLAGAALTALLVLSACAAGRISNPGGRVLRLRALTAQGVPVELGGEAGVRLVGFAASWCDECAPLVARWQGLARRNGLPLYLVLVDADRRHADSWADAAGITGFLWDPGGRSAERDVGLTRVPTLLVVDDGGRVRFVESGTHRGAEWAVADLLEASGATAGGAD